MLGMQKQILTVTNREELVINEITKILGFDRKNLCNIFQKKLDNECDLW